MADPHVVSALKHKRAEIAGLIFVKEREIEQLRADLVHLDATLRLFAPTLVPDEIPTRVSRRMSHFAPGELSRRVFDTLRERGETTAGDLAAEAMRDKGIAESDRATYRDFTNRLITTLHRLRKRGSVEPIGRGRGVRWRLAETEPRLIP